LVRPGRSLNVTQRLPHRLHHVFDAACVRGWRLVPLD
jgi:hypothetical protein